MLHSSFFSPPELFVAAGLANKFLPSIQSPCSPLNSSFFSALIVSGVQAASISSQCQSALVSIAASPDAQCINASGLSGLLLTGSGSSIIPTLDTWLKGLCSVGSCSNETLTTLVTNVTSGCGTELTSLVGTSTPSQLTSIVQEAYPTVRQMVCLEDNSNNDELCVTETLTNIQATTGTLTLSSVSALFSSLLGGGSLSLPSNTTCTSCTKAAYNVANKNFPDLVSGEKNAIEQTCGVSFVDGTDPSGISQSANTNAFSSTSTGNAGGAATISSSQAVMSSVLLASLVLGSFAAV